MGLYIWLLLFQRQEDGKTMMCDLPDEVLRCIFIQLADHQDLVNAGLAGSRTFALSEENNFWRRLCMFHFTNRQWISVLRSTEDIDSVGWKQLYCRLLRYVTSYNCFRIDSFWSMNRYNEYWTEVHRMSFGLWSEAKTTILWTSDVVQASMHVNTSDTSGKQRCISATFYCRYSVSWCLDCCLYCILPLWSFRMPDANNMSHARLSFDHQLVLV